MSDLIKFWERFKNETIYLWDDENEMYVKSIPGKGYFAKFPGREELPIASDSNTVVRAVAARHEITKGEYENA